MEDEQGNAVLTIITWVASTAALVTLLYLFVTNRWLFYVFGFVVFVCCLALIGDFTIRRITRHTYRDIGQFGTMARAIAGKTATIAPLAIEAPHTREIREVIQVPTVAQLLKEGTIGPNTLLLGYTPAGKPHYGSWDDIRTFAIAGKGRSGKTMTMFFLILQALLNDCVVWVADPHTKTSSITNMLQPLAHLMRFAKTDSDIAEMTADFIDIMELRITGESKDQTPMLLVTDEFTRMIEGNTHIYQAVVSCAQQYAGVGGYAMVAGHEWTGKEIVKLRRALHAVFVHRLDEGYARYLIDTKHAKLTEKLRTGSNFFKDTDGDMHELKTPLGTVADAATIAHMLLQIEAPYEPKQLISQQAETERFPDQLSIEAPKETKRFEKVEEIRRLRRENFNQSQIIQAIWKCKPGESQAYKDALAEYKQILQTIVQEGSQNVPMET